MKIHTRIVLDWDGQILEDEFEEYDGPISCCGGSSGGGGSSGTVDYPSYMKDRHKAWLREMDSITPVANPYLDRNAPSIAPIETMPALDEYKTYLDARQTAVGASSFTATLTGSQQGYTFYSNGLTYINSILATLSEDLNGQVPDNLSLQIEALQARLVDLASLSDLEGSFDLDTVVYPKFEAGMRDVNAIQMTSFVVGRAVIAGTYQYKIVELREQLKQNCHALLAECNKAYTDAKLESQKMGISSQTALWGNIAGFMQTMQAAILQHDTNYVETQKYLNNIQFEFWKTKEQNYMALQGMVADYVAKRMEHGRMIVVARIEKEGMEADFDEKWRRWDLENYQYAANMLAAIGSGTVAPGAKQPNKVQSALGGALSGAAAGAMVGAQMGSGGGPIGAGIGAVLGIGASLFS